MNRLLSADFYNVRKSNVTKLLLIGAFVSGILMPLFFYGILGFLKLVGNNADFLDIEEMRPMLESINGITAYLTAENIFMMVLPISEGFGLIICGAICYYNAQQFSNGIIRNKIIEGQPRSRIYISMLITSVVLATVSALLYLLTAAGMSRLCFGAFEMDASHFFTIILISTMIYMAYASIQTFAAFSTKSVPFSMIICILLPIVTNTVFSIMGTFVATMPEEILPLCAIFPTFQLILIVNKLSTTGVVIVAIISDVILTALIALLGILKFKHTDVK